MSTPPDVADRFVPRLVGSSKDELLRALYFHNSFANKQFHADLIFESDVGARETQALLVEARARTDLHPSPMGHHLRASFHPRLAERVAHVAAAKGGRIQVPHDYPQSYRKADPPHHDPTDPRPGYVTPKSLVERVQALTAVSDALRETDLRLEYVITAEGEHKLFVRDAEVSLDGLSAADLEMFERFEDFLALTARLECLVR